MRISTDSIKGLCRGRRITLTRLLREAGVSRNAFYSLAREDSILPKSLQAIAAYLGVPPTELLTTDTPVMEEMKALLAEVERIVGGCPGVSRDNVRHTLLLLREEPIDRLRRALLRAQKVDI